MVTQLEDGQAPGRPNYWLIPPNVRPHSITYGTASGRRVTEIFMESTALSTQGQDPIARNFWDPCSYGTAVPYEQKPPNSAI